VAYVLWVGIVAGYHLLQSLKAHSSLLLERRMGGRRWSQVHFTFDLYCGSDPPIRAKGLGVGQVALVLLGPTTKQTLPLLRPRGLRGFGDDMSVTMIENNNFDMKWCDDGITRRSDGDLIEQE
jgi:hypothetical protein